PVIASTVGGRGPYAATSCARDDASPPFSGSTSEHPEARCATRDDRDVASSSSASPAGMHHFRAPRDISRKIAGSFERAQGDNMSPRYSPNQIASFVDMFRRDGFVVLPGQFEPERLRAWADSFVPLFAEHVGLQGH